MEYNNPSDQRQFNQKYPINNNVNAPPYQQPYPQPIAQPVIIQQGAPNAIVVNQPLSVPNIVIVNNRWGLSPVSTTCSFCGTPITTVVEQTCNCSACCLCCFTGFLIYACIQSCNGKEMCCCDGFHKCPNWKNNWTISCSINFLLTIIKKKY